MSLGEIAYEAYHAALREYRRTHHDQFDPSGRWASLSPVSSRVGRGESRGGVRTGGAPQDLRE